MMNNAPAASAMAARRSAAKTVPLIQAAREIGIGRTAAYEQAQNGTFPCRVIRAGRRLVVPKAELARLLGDDGE